MAEYIEREAAIRVVNGQSSLTMTRSSLIDSISKLPAADVAPVVHSYWEHKITSREENISICHNCKYPVSWFWGLSKYCPNCGAKMDGVDDG